MWEADEYVSGHLHFNAEVTLLKELPVKTLHRLYSGLWNSCRPNIKEIGHRKTKSAILLLRQHNVGLSDTMDADEQMAWSAS